MTTSTATASEPRTASVDVVLPCLDEAEALPWVLERIPSGWRALVVDNGSTDGSADVARALGATVVHEERRGFGAACHAGLTAATADIVCFCDCDASLDPGDLAPFVRRIAAGEADLVLGRRRPRTRGAWPLRARVGNLALTRLLHRRTGLRLHDLGPLRAARREHLLALDLTDRRSGYPLQMVVRAAAAGWRIAEYDVPYRPRTGASKVTGTWRGTWQAVRDMSRVLAKEGGPRTAPDTRPVARTEPDERAEPAARPVAGTGPDCSTTTGPDCSTTTGPDGSTTTGPDCSTTTGPGTPTGPERPVTHGGPDARSESAAGPEAHAGGGAEPSGRVESAQPLDVRPGAHVRKGARP